MGFFDKYKQTITGERGSSYSFFDSNQFRDEHGAIVDAALHFLISTKGVSMMEEDLQKLEQALSSKIGCSLEELKTLVK